MEFLDNLVRYGWALAIAVNMLLGWIGWSLQRQFMTRREADERAKAQDAKIGEMGATVTKLEREVSDRLTRIEQRQETAPSHSDFNRMHARMDQIAVAVSRVEGALAPLDRLTTLLTQAQLDRERTAR